MESIRFSYSFSQYQALGLFAEAMPAAKEGREEEAKAPRREAKEVEVDDLAMETKRTALLDRLEKQLKTSSCRFTSRLFFSFNVTDDRKVQRAIDQEFSDWRKKNREAVNGLLIYAQSAALHLLEGPTEMIFKALEFFHSLSSEVRKAPEVQVGTTPRVNEKGELPALLSGVKILHFTELHAASVVRSWGSMVHPGKPTGNQMPMEEANCHELVFSAYLKALRLCLKVQKLLEAETDSDASVQKTYKKAADELPSVDEVLVLVGRSSAEYFFSYPEFEPWIASRTTTYLLCFRSFSSLCLWHKLSFNTIQSFENQLVMLMFLL